MVALSVGLERKLKALVDAGYYSNETEALTAAVLI